MDIQIKENVQEPERQPLFQFTRIPVGGALYAKPSDGETLEKIAVKVRNAVASFRKTHKTYNLSVHTRAEDVMVYRDSDRTEESEHEQNQ